MGKNIIQQARGKGSPTYRVPSFRYLGKAKFKPLKESTTNGKIIDLVKCQGHKAPLVKIQYDDGAGCLLQAPEGIKVGDYVSEGAGIKAMPGNVLPLKDIPEGTPVYNIESRPGDGGKFCRSSGTSARIVTKTEDEAIVLLPSKKQRSFNLNCRAAVGVIAGSGRKEKPMLKAGKMHYLKMATNKLYPRISGAAQNAVDHPFGNKRTSRKAKQKPVSRFAPPGRKVGKISPRRTGRKK